MAITNVLKAGGAFDYYESEGRLPRVVVVVVVVDFLGSRVVLIPRVKKAYKNSGRPDFGSEGWRVDDAKEKKLVIISGGMLFCNDFVSFLTLVMMFFWVSFSASDSTTTGVCLVGFLSFSSPKGG